jgi:hypothetical protein
MHYLSQGLFGLWLRRSRVQAPSVTLIMNTLWSFNTAVGERPHRVGQSGTYPAEHILIRKPYPL